MHIPALVRPSREKAPFRKACAGFALFLLCLYLAACGGSSAPAPAPAPTPAPPAAPTATLQADKTQVIAGNTVVLTWTTANATAVSIAPDLGQGSVPLSGTATIKPAATTTYQLTATGPGGSASSNVTVTVQPAPPPPPPPTVTLSANPTLITAGAASTLTWTSTNATAVTIDPAVGTAALPVNGSATVNPTATTTYTITATGPQAKATATATITAVPAGTAKSPITHLIILMMQNHSFDNLFGTFPNANGLNPTLPSYQQVDAQGNTVSPTLLSSLDVPDINHDGASYRAAYDNGLMDKYALTNGDIAMGYYDNTVSGTTNSGQTYSVNTLWNYAKQYTLADNYFASAMNSEPGNTLYMVAATVHSARSEGSLPYYDNCSARDVARDGGTISEPLTETNVGDQMNANKVPWVWYQANFDTSQNGTCTDYVPQENPFQYFTTTQNSANVKSFTLADFTPTLSDGSLPAVTWITPAPRQSMHPGSQDASNGIAWIDSVVQAVKNSPAWPSTAVVVLWDESGGWYDHVPPPQLPNADGLGARVPVILISPFAKPGFISHTQMDFVSILRFIQWNWGLGTFTDPAQLAREQQTGDLCDMLTSPCASP